MYFERTQSPYAQAAGSILDVQGLGELGLWIRELHGPGSVHGHLQLLDDLGRAVFGRLAAPDVTATLDARRTGIAAPKRLNGVFFDPLCGPDGQRYWSVSDKRLGANVGKLMRIGLRLPVGGWLPLAVAVLISDFVCYGLARYLTTPIRRLLAASAEIANGRFDVKVDSGRRRDELGDLGRDFDRMAE